ncbi:protein phosphatase 2C [Thermus thermophilus]|nr:protein phosphatase 2C [Thermus thermophilus]
MDRLEAALKTHPGLKRPKNEDAVGGEATPWGGVYVVADGMGGHRTGEVASRLAVETVLARLSREEPPSPKDLLEALEEANGRIHREAQRPENRGMGTTCTVLVLDLPYALVAHVGDSRAYLLREGNLHQLTEDHSWVAERVRQGLLSPEEARTHRWRNVITNALGSFPRPGWTSSGSSSARGTPSSSAPTGFPGSWRKGPSRRSWPTFPPPRRRSASWPWPTSGAARTT